jgi:hypothetical protein
MLQARRTAPSQPGDFTHTAFGSNLGSLKHGKSPDLSVLALYRAKPSSTEKARISAKINHYLALIS